jgi:hypothetical protein
LRVLFRRKIVGKKQDSHEFGLMFRKAAAARERRSIHRAPKKLSF